MDTWATSSLTPQIVTGWVDDPDLFERTFPMDLRPQGPEIIRTWLFDTVVRARFEHGVLPWSDTTINGWVLDPDRKKMSKSKGNVVTPMPLVEEYGPDALRYWACNGRPGVDTAVDYGIMKIGRKLAIKILNASKFTLNIADAVLADDDAAADGSRRGHERARPVAARGARGSRRRSDHRVRRVRLRACARTRRAVLLVVLRRLRRAREGPRVRRRRRSGSARRPRSRCAPRCRRCCARSRRSCRSSPKRCGRGVDDGSIHRAPWPRRGRALRVAGGDPLVFEVDRRSAAAVRKAKSEQKVSLMTPVAQVVVHDTAERLAALAPRRVRPLRGGQDRQALDRDRHGAPGRGRAGPARRRVSIAASSFPNGMSPASGSTRTSTWRPAWASRHRRASAARPRSTASARCCSISVPRSSSTRRSISRARTARPRRRG